MKGVTVIPAVKPKIIGAVVDALLSTGSYSATKYLEPNLVVRATRPFYKEEKGMKRHLNGSRKYDTRVNVVVTIGKPNHLEREFVKAAKQADEFFPVKRIQLRRMPESRQA
jgi:hypothetical protein